MMDTWMMVETAQLEAAADQIDALRKENARLRAELEEIDNANAARIRSHETAVEYFQDAEDALIAIQQRAADLPTHRRDLWPWVEASMVQDELERIRENCVDAIAILHEAFTALSRESRRTSA